jgi:hypothetical protein
MKPDLLHWPSLSIWAICLPPTSITKMFNCTDTNTHRQRLRVASGETAPGPTLEGGTHFRPKVILTSLSSIPIQILIFWPHAVMVDPRSRVLLMPPLPTDMILSVTTSHSHSNSYSPFFFFCLPSCCFPQGSLTT